MSRFVFKLQSVVSNATDPLVQETWDSFRAQDLIMSLYWSVRCAARRGADTVGLTRHARTHKGCTSEGLPTAPATHAQPPCRRRSCCWT
jgi:hypothetical protein